jgi:beta-glucanase (GH16 family)
VQGAIHFGGANSTYAWYGWSNGDSVTNFHAYSLDWTSNAISWSVDGQVSGTATNWWSSAKYPFPAPFDTPFHIIMNLAVGGDYLGNPSTNAINASLPGEMLVDYVRVYDYTEPLALTVALTNGNVLLRWPTNIACHLQCRINPGGGSSAGNWLDMAVASNPFIFPPSNRAAIYRLISP